jgi:hypothetical protein
MFLVYIKNCKMNLIFVHIGPMQTPFYMKLKSYFVKRDTTYSAHLITAGKISWYGEYLIKYWEKQFSALQCG